MKTIVLAGLLAVSSFAAIADNSNASPASSALMSKWDRLDKACRGGSGDNPSVLSACRKRDETYPGIEKLGWCRGPDDAPGYLKDWVKCAAPVAVQASTMDRNTYCVTLGGLYDSASAWRDRGASPQMAFDSSKGFGLSDKDTKEAINNVYFNPALANARGTAFGMQVSHVCMFGPAEPFTPLN